MYFRGPAREERGANGLSVDTSGAFVNFSSSYQGRRILLHILKGYMRKAFQERPSECECPESL